MTHWYDRAFGPAYDELYPHRDDEDAARDVDRVLQGGVRRDRRLLDLCCGNGRHLELFARAGFESLVGLDRSCHLLARARERLPADVPLVRGDIRCLPLQDASFDSVVNLFTSFGYFDDDAEHGQALGEVRRVLVPGGRFYMDHVDRQRLTETLVPESKTERADGVILRAERRMRGNRVEKRLTSSDGSIDHHESVRLWFPDELTALLADSGLVDAKVTLQDGRMRIWAVAR